MKRIFLILLMMPLVIMASVNEKSDDLVRYLMMIDEHIFYYHKMVTNDLKTEPVELKDLDSEREKQIFFSGCLASVNSLKFRYILKETHR